jgi:hypothetical protein
MAEIDVHFDDHGSQERIQRLAVFLTDLRSFWPLVVPLATGWWRRQFESEGEFGGQRWAALSPDYAAWKETHFPGKGILQRTGDLKRAASAPARAVTPTSMTLTIEDDKLAYHQEGTVYGPLRAGQGRLPARPLVFGEPLPAEAQAELDLVAEGYVTDLLGRV